MLKSVIAALLLFPAAAHAQTQTLYSKTFHAPPLPCDGVDHIAALLEPWEPVPIVIRGAAISHVIEPGGTLLSPEDSALVVTGATIGHIVRRFPPGGWAFVGSSNPEDGDLLTPVVVGPNGSDKIIYPVGTGFIFPAAGGTKPPFIDIHMSCHSGANDQAWAVIYYTKGAAP